MTTIQIKNPDVQFQVIDIEDNEHIAKQYGIRSIPTVILEKNGKIVQTIMGAQTESVYTAAISNWK